MQGGVVKLLEPLDAREGQEVLITLLGATAEEVSAEASESVAKDWERLASLIKSSQIPTGISDLAEQHDHYRVGKPKHLADE